MQKKNMEPKAKLLEELVIDVKSVVKVNKGGRQRRFSAIAFPTTFAASTLLPFSIFKSLSNEEADTRVVLVVSSIICA